MVQSIRIGFSTRGDPVSRFIRWVTSSRVSHCFLLVPDSFLGCDLVLEAYIGGFQVTRYDAFLRQNRVVRTVAPEHSILRGVQESTRWLGTRYDYLGLFGALLMMVARWFKRKIRNPLHDPHAMLCSEVVVRALQAAAYPGAAGLDPASTTPEDLLEFLDAAATPEPGGGTVSGAAERPQGQGAPP